MGGVDVPVVQVSMPYNGVPQQAVMVLELSTATHDLPEHESMAKLEPEGKSVSMELPPAVPIAPVSGGIVCHFALTCTAPSNHAELIDRRLSPRRCQNEGLRERKNKNVFNSDMMHHRASRKGPQSEKGVRAGGAPQHSTAPAAVTMQQTVTHPATALSPCRRVPA